ncbi:MAG: hypothetical protein KUG77_21740 [Nannocystaceae bacterium]|nr:hypothetical protein [Nannocystaceae bacterium]
MKSVYFAAAALFLGGCGQQALTEAENGSSGAQETDGLLGDASGFPGDEDGDSTEPDPSGAGCDVFEQDCPGAQKCVPYSADGDQTWNGLRCSALPSEPRQLGESCVAPEGPVAGVDDCDVGLMCWGIPQGETAGVCTSLCEGSAAAGLCPTETVCAVYNSGALPVCLPTCDPLGSGCADGKLCIPQGGAGGRFVCAVDASPTTGGYGDPCLAFNKCDPGMFCAPADAVPGCALSSGCCSRICDLGEDDPDRTCDGESQVCVPFFDTAPAPGFESVGGCSAA